MRRTLKLNYIIIITLSIILIIYLSLFHEDEESKRRKELTERLYNVGNKIMNYFVDYNPAYIQKTLFKNNKGIDLEDIAIFVDTLSISKDSRYIWDSCDINRSLITLRGHYDSNKKITIIMIESNHRLIIRAVNIDNNTLIQKSSKFPFNITRYKDINGSKGVSNSE